MTHSKKQLPLFVDPTILPTNKYHISYSEIYDHLECSYRHKLKHVDKLGTFTGSIHTEFGSTVHDVLEEFVLGRTMITEEVVAAAQTRFREQCIRLNKEALFAVPPGELIKEKDVEDFSSQMPDMLGQVPGFLDAQFPGWKGFAGEMNIFESIDGQTNKYLKGFIDAVIQVPRKIRKSSVAKAPSKRSIMRLSTLKGEDVEPLAVGEEDETEKDVKISPLGEKYDYVLLDWKGQRLTAPILTPTGWTTMGALKVGDKITSSDGTPCLVEAVFPLGERDVYRVSLRDGSYVDTTDDHLWSVRTVGGITKVMSTVDLMKRKSYRYLPVISKPAMYDLDPNLKLDPYLLGVLLGDGCLRRGSVSFSTADEDILVSVCNSLPAGISAKKIQEDKYDYRITTDDCHVDPRLPRNLILNAIREYGLNGKKSYEKFIPRDYKVSSPEDRLSMVQGLLDTDGWVQKGCVKFSSTSRQLVDDLKEIVGSLGGITFLSIRNKKRNLCPEEKMEYILTVRLPEEMKPFRLNRKLEKLNKIRVQGLYRKINKIEKIGRDRMQCIGVSSPDHLYITNDFVLTHNTSSWGWDASKKRDYQKQLQLMLYKHFFCKMFNLNLDRVKCGFVLIKRTPRKGGERCELVKVSVGPKSQAKAVATVHTMLNSVMSGRYMKNRQSCRFCEFKDSVNCR